ncbi:MAG: oligosaccharide flippase family protein [Candidatus Woesebacteria bacterium]
MGYTRDFLKGLGWIGFFRFGVKAIIFFKVIIAYRYLSPREVGLFGLAAIALGLLEMVTETGINVVLIRDTKHISYYLDTAFLISIGRGILIGAILLLSSFLLPTFFRDPGLFPLLLIVSLIPVIKGFINPAEVIFVKDLRFEKEAIFRIGLALIDALSAVLLVFYFHSAQSLIWAMVITALSEVIISFLFIHPRPGVSFNRGIYHEIMSPGKWINLTGIVTYAEQNFDNVIVGRVLGATSLGYYQTAFNLTRSGVAEIGVAFSQVLLPIYGRIVGDSSRIRKAVAKVLIPAAGMMLLVAVLLNVPQIQNLLLFFLKEKWRPMLILFPYLSVTAWITGMDTLIVPLFIAKNKIKLLALLYTLGLVLMIGFMFIFTETFGLTGAALAVMISRLLLQPFFIWNTIKIVQEKQKG